MTLKKSGTTKLIQINIHEKMTIDNWLLAMSKTYRRRLKINREDV
jgi:hypothetical protein